MIMKKYLAFFCSLALLSCQGIEQKPLEELGCPEDVVKLPAEGGTAYFSIYANATWSGVVNDDWLYLEPDGGKNISGNGDGAVILSCSRNANLTRSGTATLSLGSRSITLTVVQRGELSPESSVEAELIGKSSSTLSFTFGEGDTDELKRANPYRIALWNDRDTTSLVVAHRISAKSTIWSGAPKFTFGGLQSGRTYYFGAINLESGECSAIIPATTSEFTNVSPTAVSSPAVGDVILAEDFSLIPWNGDDVLAAAGFKANVVSAFVAPSGETPEGVYVNRSAENLLFDDSGFLAASDASRLKNWYVMGQDGAADNRTRMAFARVGYLKLGGYSWCAALVSPALSCLPTGYSAKARLQVVASRYFTDDQHMLISVTEGETSGHVYTAHARTDYQRLLRGEMGWQEYTLDLEGLSAYSHIMIGPDWETAGTGLGKAQHRMFVSSIKLTLTDLSKDITVKNVTMRKVLFHEATATWDVCSDASGYNVYLDGAFKGKTTEGSFSFSELEQGRKYTLMIGALTASGEEMASGDFSFTTAGVRQVDSSPTSLCVEWDELYDVAPTKLETGQDRLYEMALYKDQSCTQELVKLYPFDGDKTQYYSFCSGGTSTAHWNGMVGGVNRLMATRISIGCLTEGTTYWFRVRSLEQATVKDGYVMTNSAGTSSWSDPISVSTTMGHTPSSGELVFQGFDRYSIQRDVHNNCPGMSLVMTSSQRSAFTGCTLPYSAGCNLNTYKGMGDAYAISDFGAMFKAQSGEAGNYAAGVTFNGVTQYIDADSWHYGGKFFPEMGCLQMDSKSEYFIGTPFLNSALLSESGTACTLRFDAFAFNATYSTNSGKPMKIMIVHSDGSIDNVSCPNIPYKYLNSSPDANNFIYDTSWRIITQSLTLKRGDAVLLVSNGNSRAWFDNISIKISE